MSFLFRSRGFPASASSARHAVMTRMRRFDLENQCYHVTTATRNRTPVFEDPIKAEVLLDAIDFVRAKGRSLALAYCVMPDHVHMVLAPREGNTLSQVVQSIKGFTARRLNAMTGRSGSIWQASFHDRVIRDEPHLRDTVTYVHQSPVAEGFVGDPAEYAFSSAHPRRTHDLEEYSGGIER